MSNSDDLVKAWFLSKWLKGEGGFYPTYKPLHHGEFIEIEVITMDGTWECGCYSEYTRDDQEKLIATVKTRAGEVEVEYATWRDLPYIIRDIINFEALEDVCRIEEDCE